MSYSDFGTCFTLHLDLIYTLSTFAMFEIKLCEMPPVWTSFGSLFIFNTVKLKFQFLFEWASAWFLHLTEIYKAVISVGLIVFGAFVAGARDFSFDAYGYAVVFMSNIATAIYLATISRIGCIPILSFSHMKLKFYNFFLWPAYFCL